MESKECIWVTYNTSHFNPFVFKSAVVINSLTAVTATLLNAALIHAIWKTPSLRRPSLILISSLTLSDFCTGLIAQPLFSLYLLAALFDHEAMFCYAGISARFFLHWFAAVSVFTLAVISVDRFLAVRLKTAYSSIVTIPRVLKIATFGWIFKAIVIGTVMTQDHGSLTYAYATFGLTYLVVITLMYALSFWYLGKYVRRQVTVYQRRDSSIFPPTAPSFNISKYRSSITTMLIVLMCIQALYCPIVVYQFINLHVYRYRNQCEQEMTFLHLSEVIAALNSSISPVIYMVRMRELKVAVTGNLRKIFGVSEASSNVTE